MKFLDQAKVYVALRRRRRRLRRFRREKFIEFGGPNGGDGGRGGDVVGRVRRRPQHADRLPLPAAFQGRRRGQHGMGQNRAGAKRRRRGPEGAGRHARSSPRTARRCIADLTGVGPARAACAKGGNGGFGNAHFKTSTNRAPRRANPGPAGRGALDLAAAEAHRRCRARRPAERRQVDLPRGRHGGQAEDRRLSLHHPASRPRRGARRRARVRARRHPGPDRGRRTRARASATASSAMSSAAACCCTSSTARASTPARPTRSSARELEAYGHGLAEKPEIVALVEGRRARRRHALGSRRAPQARREARRRSSLSAASGRGRARRCCGPLFAVIGGAEARATADARQRRPRGLAAVSPELVAVPPHRPQGRLGAARRPRSAAAEAGLARGARRGHRRAARARRRRARRLLRRHRARPHGARPAARAR